MSIIPSEEPERIKQTMRDWFGSWLRDCRLDFLISQSARLSVSHADISVSYGTFDVPMSADRGGPEVVADRQNDAIDPYRKSASGQWCVLSCLIPVLHRYQISDVHSADRMLDLSIPRFEAT